MNVQDKPLPRLRASQTNGRVGTKLLSKRDDAGASHHQDRPFSKSKVTAGTVPSSSLHHQEKPLPKPKGTTILTVNKLPEYVTDWGKNFPKARGAGTTNPASNYHANVRREIGHKENPFPKPQGAMNSVTVSKGQPDNNDRPQQQQQDKVLSRPRKAVLDSSEISRREVKKAHLSSGHPQDKPMPGLHSRDSSIRPRHHAGERLPSQERRGAEDRDQPLQKAKQENGKAKPLHQALTHQYSNTFHHPNEPLKSSGGPPEPTKSERKPSLARNLHHPDEVVKSVDLADFEHHQPGARKSIGRRLSRSLQSLDKPGGMSPQENEEDCPSARLSLTHQLSNTFHYPTEPIETLPNPGGNAHPPREVALPSDLKTSLRRETSTHHLSNTWHHPDEPIKVGAQQFPKSKDDKKKKTKTSVSRKPHDEKLQSPKQVFGDDTLKNALTRQTSTHHLSNTWHHPSEPVKVGVKHHYSESKEGDQQARNNSGDKKRSKNSNNRKAHEKSSNHENEQPANHVFDDDTLKNALTRQASTHHFSNTWHHPSEPVMYSKSKEGVRQEKPVVATESKVSVSRKPIAQRGKGSDEQKKQDEPPRPQNSRENVQPPQQATSSHKNALSRRASTHHLSNTWHQPTEPVKTGLKQPSDADAAQPEKPVFVISGEHENRNSPEEQKNQSCESALKPSDQVSASSEVKSALTRRASTHYFSKTLHHPSEPLQTQEAEKKEEPSPKEPREKEHQPLTHQLSNTRHLPNQPVNVVQTTPTETKQPARARLSRTFPLTDDIVEENRQPHKPTQAKQESRKSKTLARGILTKKQVDDADSSQLQQAKALYLNNDTKMQRQKDKSRSVK